MKLLLSTTALIALLATTGIASADNDMSGKSDHHGGHYFMDEALSKLPADDAAKFRDTMKQSREKDKALFEKTHKLHEELRALLTAEKFDKAAYVAKSKEIMKLHNTMHDHMTEAFATAANQLSQDDRKILADSIHEHMHKHHHHKDGQGKSQDKPMDNSNGDKAPDTN